MAILYLLIPVSLVVLLIGLIAFRWAVKNEQFDDLDSPAMIPLTDDTEDERAQQRQTP